MVSSGASSGTGLRTATAQVETPRIITPSSTAWPPTGASRVAIRRPSGSWVGSSLTYLAGAGPRYALALGAGRRGLAPLRRAALEALDPATGVDQLLPAGVERVAV